MSLRKRRGGAGTRAVNRSSEGSPPVRSTGPHGRDRAASRGGEFRGDPPAAQESGKAEKGERGERGRPEILAGWHPVHEALRAGDRRIRRILVAEDRHDGRVAEIVRLGKEAKVPISRVPVEALRRAVPRDLPHQGIVAEVSPRAYADAEVLLQGIGRASLFVLLDEVQDPRNLGAILRTAAAVGASGIFIPLHRSASLTPSAERASAGGADQVPIARVSNLGKLLSALGEEGVCRIGLDPRANDLYTEIPGDVPIALVLGSEEGGLRPSIRGACDRLVRIPVPGRMDSLNVSVAAALALYEVLRARSRTAGP